MERLRAIALMDLSAIGIIPMNICRRQTVRVFLQEDPRPCFTFPPKHQAVRPLVGRQAALPLGAEAAEAVGGGDGQRMTRELRRGNLIKMRPVVYLSKSYIPLSRRPTVRRMGRDHRQKQVDQPITPTPAP